MERGISLVEFFAGKITETNWSLRQRIRKYLWPLNRLQTHHNPSFLKKEGSERCYWPEVIFEAILGNTVRQLRVTLNLTFTLYGAVALTTTQVKQY